jgi:hypothetical protein
VTDNENRKPGAPRWWALWTEYKSGLGRAAWLLDQLRSADSHTADEYARCIAMLDEAQAAIAKAKDARRQLHELGQTGTEKVA